MPEKTTIFRVEVGERLRRLREVKDLDQSEIGEIIGMVPGGVSMIEKGQRGLDPQHALRLKRAFGVPLDWFYAGEVGQLPKDLYRPLTMRSVEVAPPPQKSARKPR